LSSFSVRWITLSILYVKNVSLITIVFASIYTCLICLCGLGFMFVFLRCSIDLEEFLISLQGLTRMKKT
jgi:hypothetical protein